MFHIFFLVCGVAENPITLSLRIKLILLYHTLQTYDVTSIYQQRRAGVESFVFERPAIPGRNKESNPLLSSISICNEGSKIILLLVCPSWLPFNQQQMSPFPTPKNRMRLLHPKYSALQPLINRLSSWAPMAFRGGNLSHLCGSLYAILELMKSLSKLMNTFCIIGTFPAKRRRKSLWKRHSPASLVFTSL